MKTTKTKYWWASLILIIVFFIAMIIYLSQKPFTVWGDGHEYMLQTASFQNHFSFGINESDLQLADEQFYLNADRLNEVYGRLRTTDEGLHYSNHFGAYSVLVTPVKLILTAMNVYPMWAFWITNLLLWLASVLTVFFCLKADDKKKFCVICLLLFNPIIFYLDWVHTEVYIFAFTVIGLVFLYNKKHSLAIISVSVAALQNLAVIPLAAMIGIDYIIECIKKYKEQNTAPSCLGFVRSYWKKIIPYGAFYIIAFVPIITTYYRFGTFSLVADVAMESKYLLHKAIDYLIDLNIGILPFEPIILVLFLIMTVIGFKKCTQSSIINFISLVGILYVIANQRQINCGMQFIMRYCVWIIPIMVFYIVMNWEKCFARSGAVAVSAIQSAFTLLISCYCIFGGGYYTNLQFANWTKKILDTMPSIYNPSHGIFYSRYSRIYNFESYYSQFPKIYTSSDNKVRKILLSNLAEERFFSDEYVLYDEDTNTIVDKNQIKKHYIDEGEFCYLNFNGNIGCYTVPPSDNTILFYADNYNADKYVINGLSRPENWGSWTDGDSVCMNVFANTDEEYFVCNIDVAKVFYQEQNVDVWVNDELVFSGVVSDGNDDIRFIFKNPKNGLIKMRIDIPDSSRPSDVLDSSDTRKLGIGLSSMTVEPIDKSAFSYIAGDTISFRSDKYNADKYAESGLSVMEEWGSWTDGNELFMDFYVNSDKEYLTCNIDIAKVFYSSQNIKVYINDEPVFSDIITDDSDNIQFTFKNPDDGFVKMKIDIPDSIPPSYVSDSKDNRDLGIGIVSMVME